MEGTDLLADFPPETAQHLRRLASFRNVGDIVVNSLYDREHDQVAAFEELIGSRSGAGGLQTRPFILFPSGWSQADPSIVGPEAMHALLSRFVEGSGTAGSMFPH
ncbi:MAG: hypothetical protein ACR2PL_17155 [Dehalococcoidia bacterium]